MSLTVIVEPNNYGKSRILIDILNIITKGNNQTVILDTVDISMLTSLEDLKNSYEINSFKDEHGGVSLRTLSNSLSDME
jgi:hypothetical protein